MWLLMYSLGHRQSPAILRPLIYVGQATENLVQFGSMVAINTNHNAHKLGKYTLLHIYDYWVMKCHIHTYRSAAMGVINCVVFITRFPTCSLCNVSLNNRANWKYISNVITLLAFIYFKTITHRHLFASNYRSKAIANKVHWMTFNTSEMWFCRMSCD